MQKVLLIISICVLGAFVFLKSVKSNNLVADDLFLKNVEALANTEDSWGHLPIDCIMFGDYKCPKNEQRVKYIVEGYGLHEDEETY